VAEQKMTYEQKVKSYMKVFYILIALTIVELIFVEIPKFFPSVPHLPMVILICAASLAKAVYVGYYYMHLNHETPWLRKLVFLSLIGFFYAIVLIPDTIYDRKITPYIPEPPRVYKTGAKAEEAKAEAQVETSGTSPDGVSAEGSTTPNDTAAPVEEEISAEEAEWQ
jgi:cytochrome c oxidase subunit IV